MNEPKDITIMDTPHPTGDAASQPPPEEAKARSALTHDLKNAVYAIMLQAECAETHTAAGETDAALRGLARIKSAARDTAGLLDDLLKDVE